MRVNSPGGPLFAAGFSTGSAQTGVWVTNGMTFYLQDASGGANSATSSAATLATLTLHLQAPSSGSGGSGNGETGVITGTPDPAQYPSGGGPFAETTITWSCSACTTTEVHVNSPNGLLFATGLSSGTATTGNWVANGMIFYLQDSSKGNGGSASNTIATFAATVESAPSGPPSFSNGGTITTDPNPILVSGVYGQTELIWSCAACTTTEVHIGSPGGPLFAAGTSTGFATTGTWVTNGMVFYLQNSSNGNATDPANTVGWIEVDTQPQ